MRIASLIFLLFLIGACTDQKPTCNYSINWNIQKVGDLYSKGVAGAIGFIFLSPTTILVNNFPAEGSISAPLQIYRNLDGRWYFDSYASAKLPSTFHPRQMVMEDIDGDGKKEVIIADHGTDRPPFPGGHPIILKEVNGEWVNDKSATQLGLDFTFNVAIVDLPNHKKAIYKANVFSKNPFFYSYENGRWKDISKTLPEIIQSQHTCLMTALYEDFNLDGKKELFLGGCDQKTSRADSLHDRLLSMSDKGWVLLPESVLPERLLDGSWGTVFTKVIDWNKDSKPDILFATHDFGFHTFRVGIYLNQSNSSNIKFDKLLLPFNPEKNSEGYMNSLEDFEIPGIGTAIIGEYRTVVRSNMKVRPKTYAHLVIKSDDKISEENGCLPKELKTGLFQALKFPDSSGKILFVPYHGQILTLNPVKK